METYHFGVASLVQRDDLGEGDQDHIPEWDDKYEFQEDSTEAVALAAQEKLPGLLVGPTGCGKSTLVLNIAALLDQPVRRINFISDFRTSDIMGEKVLMVDPETAQSIVVWRDGVLPDAMRRGHWILLDELDAAPAGIVMALQSVLEPSRRVTLGGNHGEVVTAHPHFRIFATANTLGKGDESGLYTGTHTLNEATLDRFVVLRCDYPPPDQEVSILTGKTNIDIEVAKKLVEAARLVRGGYEKGECYCTMSTRKLLAWALLAMRFNPKRTASGANVGLTKAFRLAIWNKLTKEDAMYVAGVVQRVVGIRSE